MDCTRRSRAENALEKQNLRKSDLKEDETPGAVRQKAGSLGMLLAISVRNKPLLRFSNVPENAGSPPAG
jgi:hypothetical protein